jgi:hypothetical protein
MSQENLNVSEAAQELARRQDHVIQVAVAATEHIVGMELLHMALGTECGGPGADRRHDAFDAYRDLVNAVLALQGRDEIQFMNEKWSEATRGRRDD